MHLGDVSPQVRSWLSSAKDTETLRKMMKLLSEHEERMELKTRKHQMWMREQEERRQREKIMGDEEERRE